jgi:predicted metalloprotease
MDWRGRRESSEVEDVRGRRVGRGGAAIGGGGLLLILVFALLTGRNPLTLLQALGTGTTVSTPDRTTGPTAPGAPKDEASQFVSVVLADTEDTWKRVFAEKGETYQLPKLVLFTDAIRSACGRASAAVGPFYCPADRKVYLDLGFFHELAQRFGASGDFAQAYVVAHEVGHHVQNLLGISDRISDMQARASKAQANSLSVRLELQADCLAGVWGKRAGGERRLLQAGDVEEGLAAAAAIGDDRLQRQAQGYVAPESFTHGSSAQRVRWLKRGLESGSPDACNTFAAGQL